MASEPKHGTRNFECPLQADSFISGSEDDGVDSDEESLEVALEPDSSDDYESEGETPNAGEDVGGVEEGLMKIGKAFRKSSFRELSCGDLVCRLLEEDARNETLDSVLRCCTGC